MCCFWTLHGALHGEAARCGQDLGGSRIWKGPGSGGFRWRIRDLGTQVGGFWTSGLQGARGKGCEESLGPGTRGERDLRSAVWGTRDRSRKSRPTNLENKKGLDDIAWACEEYTGAEQGSKGKERKGRGRRKNSCARSLCKTSWIWSGPRVRPTGITPGDGSGSPPAVQLMSEHPCGRQRLDDIFCV